MSSIFSTSWREFDEPCLKNGIKNRCNLLIYSDFGWNVGLEPTKLSTKKSKIKSVDFQQFINSIYYHFCHFLALVGRILAEF